MNFTRWLSLAVISLAGCGPIGLGYGLSELFSDSKGGDPGAPALEFESTEDYESEPPVSPVPATNRVTQTIAVTTNVRGVEMVGRFFGADNLPGDPEAEDLKPLKSDSPEPGASILKHTIHVDLPAKDGVHILRVRARDAQRRLSRPIDFAWVFDDVEPETPAGLVVTAKVPRRFHLEWSESRDPGNADEPVATEYVISLTPLEGADPAPAPSLPSCEPAIQECVPASALEKLDGGTVSIDVPSGRELLACRDYRIEIRAADRAGNRSDDVAAVEHRTRSGGDGTFRPIPIETRTVASPGTVRVADVDGDGLQDLAYIDGDAVMFATGNRGRGSNGGRLLDDPNPVPLPKGFHPVFFAIADVVANPEEDWPEFVVLGDDGGVVVRDFLGNGPEEPVSVRTFDGSGVTTVLGIADFDDDSHLDLAVCAENLDGAGDPSVGTFTVLRGDGKGGFVHDEIYFVGKGAHAIRALDLDGDDRADAAVLDRDVLRVFLSTAEFGIALALQVGGEPTSLAAGDFNADGMGDLVVGLRSGAVTVVLGAAEGSFLVQPTRPAVDGPALVEVADVNGDRIPDLVVLSEEHGYAQVLLGGGSQGTADGTFAKAARAFRDNELNLFVDPIGPFGSFAVADLNSDSIMDIAAATCPLLDGQSAAAEESVMVMLGNGATRRASGAFEFMGRQSTGVDGTIAGTADFNVDGVTDLLWRTQSVSEQVDFIDVLLADSIDGQGTGRSDRERTLKDSRRFTRSVSFSAGTINGLGVGFFNDDDVPDIAITEETLNLNNAVDRVGLRVLLGGSRDRARDGALRVTDVQSAPPAHQPVPGANLSRGFFRLSAKETTSSETPPTVITVEDYDGDGRSDLAVLLPSVTEDTLLELETNPLGPILSGLLKLASPKSCGVRAGVWLYRRKTDGEFEIDNSLTDAFFQNVVLAPSFSFDLDAFGMGRRPTKCEEALADFDQPTEMATGIIRFNSGVNSARRRSLVCLRGRDLQVIDEPLPASGARVSDRIPVGSVPHSLTMADLHGDGLSAALVLDGSKVVVVELTLKDPPPAKEAVIEVDTTYEETDSPERGLKKIVEMHTVDGHELLDIAVADLNQDHRPDIAVLGRKTDGTGFSVCVLLQGADGVFEDAEAYAVDPDGSPVDVKSIAIADFTGDGVPDIALGGDSIYLLRGLGEIIGN